MSNTNLLIKEAACDIIGVITIWGVLNNLYVTIRFNDKIYPIYPYMNLIGVGISTYILRKYM